ncbi:putative nuclease HARBI1 [Portunus trituberculatus]|uniref:Putative nuclease HARBI1 n=1 Tax=Portunus trituberculatus TaxID=210409 RepID=A0A5B7GNZ5_PORTR|nr:putative nuclease HARBI1 [Portunus trituberculatus]
MRTQICLLTDAHHFVPAATTISFLCFALEVIAARFYCRALRRERRFRDRLDPLTLSDGELLLTYRFSRQELILRFKEMEPLLRRTRRSHTLLVHTHVLLALSVFASDSFQGVIGDTVVVNLARKAVNIMSRDFLRERECKCRLMIGSLLVTSQ